MTPEDLTEYLHDVIPLSAAMEARVIEVREGTVTVEAPLGPNSNHRGTAFGGSLSALAVIAGFSTVLLGLRLAGFQHRVVIQRNEYSYLLPAVSSFTATARIEPRRWQRFINTIERRGRGRVIVDVTVSSDGHRVGHLEGVFAALPPTGD